MNIYLILIFETFLFNLTLKYKSGKIDIIKM